MTYAESKYQIAEQHKVWMIGEYEDGIPIFIPVGTNVNGKTYGTFYCLSAFSSWTQTINVELVIPY